MYTIIFFVSYFSILVLIILIFCFVFFSFIQFLFSFQFNHSITISHHFFFNFNPHSFNSYSLYRSLFFNLVLQLQFFICFIFYFDPYFFKKILAAFVKVFLVFNFIIQSKFFCFIYFTLILILLICFFFY